MPPRRAEPLAITHLNVLLLRPSWLFSRRSRQAGRREEGEGRPWHVSIYRRRPIDTEDDAAVRPGGRWVDGWAASLSLSPPRAGRYFLWGYGGSNARPASLSCISVTLPSFPPCVAIYPRACERALLPRDAGSFECFLFQIGCFTVFL